MNRKQLDGMLGMYEMEMAVEVMLQKAESLNISVEQVGINAQEFIEKDEKGELKCTQGALTGFCQLAWRELVKPLYPNCTWNVTQKLLDIMKKQGFQVGDEMSFEQWCERRFKRMWESK